MSSGLESWEFKNWHLKGLMVIFWLFVSRCLAGVRGAALDKPPTNTRQGLPCL